MGCYTLELSELAVLPVEPGVTGHDTERFRVLYPVSGYDKGSGGESDAWPCASLSVRKWQTVIVRAVKV